MPTRDIKILNSSLFSPLVEAAARTPKGRVYTQKIPKERQAEQFRRFREIEVDSGQAVAFPSGGFLARLRENDYEFVIFSAPGLNGLEIVELADALTGSEGLEEVEFDETMLLYCAHELKGLLNLKLDYRNPVVAGDILDLADTEDYAGHSIYDIRRYFNDVYAFRVEADNRHHGANVTELALTFLLHQPNLRSPIIDREAGDKICALKGMRGCDDDRLFQALTSSQWAYTFLDLYRCMESLYFFPWLRNLKGSLGSTSTLFTLRQSCWSVLGWNPKEDASIKKLFDLVDDNVFQDEAPNVSLFSDLRLVNSPPSSYAKKVYSARNAMVHHADRRTQTRDSVSAAEYRQLCIFLCAVLRNFHNKFSAEFP